ncbi:MAG TPA: hypothetical protein VFC25_12910 [Verrucomicrobiae bacterium]|nr:hypothetical protein [Verrucomicrobiae bacterium]
MTRTGIGLPVRADWSRATRPGWVTASVFGLVVMATWTLVIKDLAPVLYAAAERSAGRDIAAPILWDFWWVAHLALAWLLWNGHRMARAAGYAIASVEIVIVVVKFVLFLRAPEWTFWRLLWFTNKIYVLGFFCLFLAALLRRRPADG